MIRKLLFFILLGLSGFVYSQTQTDSSGETSLEEYLKEIEKNYHIKFSYSPELLKGKLYPGRLSGQNLDEILLSLSLSTGLNFNKLDEHYYYITLSSTEELNRVVVEAYLTRGITKESDGSFRYKIKNFGLLPGLTDNDILESIQLLPGIANIDESATNFYVRGGLPDQNRQIWDGINIYHNGHLFGLISPFNPNAIDKISFYYKGTPARYGERAASVIEMRTYAQIPHKTHFEWGLNGIYSDFFLHMPLVKEKLSIQASFRRSYEDFFETPVFTNYEAKAFQNASINNDYFYFKDYHFKINFIPNEKQRFFVSFLHVDNDLESNTEQDMLEVIDFLDTENTGISIGWDWDVHPFWQWKNSFSHSYYSLHYNNIEKNNQELSLDFHKRNSILDNFFSTSLQSHNNRNKSWEFGLQFTEKSVDYSLTEQKNIFLVLDKSYDYMRIFSAFSNFNINKNNYDLSIGLRANLYSDFGKVKWEPRLVFNKKITPRFHLQITGEIKDQVIWHLRNSFYNSFTLEDKIWRLSDFDKYPVITSYHTTLGGLFKTKNWMVDFDFYYKNIQGLTSYSLGIFNPNDPTLYTGEQKITGFDLFIKKDFRKIKTRLSYTFSDIKNRFDGFNGSKFFTSSSDVRHSFNTGISYKYKRLNFALGWIYRLGKPTSEIEDEEDEIYLEEINEYRLPDYNRLDFSSSYSFYFSETKKVKGKIGLSIRNLLNNKIIINKDFIGNSSIGDDIKILNYYSLGMTPNFMFRIYW